MGCGTSRSNQIGRGDLASPNDGQTVVVASTLGAPVDSRPLRADTFPLLGTEGGQGLGPSPGLADGLGNCSGTDISRDATTSEGNPIRSSTVGICPEISKGQERPAATSGMTAGDAQLQELGDSTEVAGATVEPPNATDMGSPKATEDAEQQQEEVPYKPFTEFLAGG